MLNLKRKNYLLILFLLSLSTLIIAYSIQYIMGYQPCNLCLIERIPYALAIIVLILNYIFKKDQLFYTILLLIIFSFSFLISLYHFGIEEGLINESNICTNKNMNLMTKEDVLKSLQNIIISCKDVAFRVYGLSLTSYNMILSMLMILISIKIYLINDDKKK